jgi:hypothetical protein
MTSCSFDEQQFFFNEYQLEYHWYFENKNNLCANATIPLINSTSTSISEAKAVHASGVATILALLAGSRYLGDRAHQAVLDDHVGN